MSAETARRLEQANATFLEVEQIALERKREFLAAVAGNLPKHAKDLAKRTAQAQPEVTRALGSQGVAKLKDDLQTLADELAADLASAETRITWPAAGAYSPVKPKDVRSSLFNYMYGPKVNKFANLFKGNGYDVQDDNARNSQGLVLPQWLFSEEELAPEISRLAEVLVELFKAGQAVEAAKKADDLATVNDLWGD